MYNSGESQEDRDNYDQRMSNRTPHTTSGYLDSPQAPLGDPRRFYDSDLKSTVSRTAAASLRSLFRSSPSSLDLLQLQHWNRQQQIRQDEQNSSPVIKEELPDELPPPAALGLHPPAVNYSYRRPSPGPSPASTPVPEGFQYHQQQYQRPLPPSPSPGPLRRNPAHLERFDPYSKPESGWRHQRDEGQLPQWHRKDSYPIPHTATSSAPSPSSSHEGIAKRSAPYWNNEDAQDWSRPSKRIAEEDRQDHPVRDERDHMLARNLLSLSNDSPVYMGKPATSKLLPPFEDSKSRSRFDSERDSAGESWPTYSCSPSSSVDGGGGNEHSPKEQERCETRGEVKSEEDGNSTAIPAVDIEFNPSDLALATVPGTEFDPKSRAFSTDELRPQPIIKKRGKVFVPDEKKDDKYWNRRIKNNVAARRSREARRLKENQIALRAAFLESENKALKEKIEELHKENKDIGKDVQDLAEKLRRLEELLPAP